MSKNKSDLYLGKSYKGRTENPGFYSKMNNKWWEDYVDQEAVLIEDIGQTHLWMGDFLKIWADRYGFRSEIKNASVVLRPKKIIVTSNYHPRELWPDPSVHEPLLRRFQLIELKDKFKYPKPALIRTQPRLFSPIIEPFLERSETIKAMMDPIYNRPYTNEEPVEIMDVEKQILPPVPLMFTPEKPRIDVATHWTRCNICKHLHCDCTCVTNLF